MDHWDAIASERLALADQLDPLSPEQWDTQSLCDAWTVRDIAAHLVVPHRISIPAFLVTFVAAGGSFSRANVALTAKQAKRPTPDIIADIRRFADSRAKPPGFGSEAPLSEVLVHGQDIRIPLGLDDTSAIESWAAALDFLVMPKARRGFVSRSLQGFHFVASDIDWSHGTGDEVRGPAVALALAMMGRKARLEDLAGPGASRLVGEDLS
ncbi:MAG TPA: maleylpyruvate isomerase family mycothiol-dependent enzyme [Acidimicrobiales bacterium]|nr:maleylpyruvate isomerase family mycothiol-dependent enzyme [Acidimicrobiales bacterium]HWF20564.1 maleylpyruvate isomerase family mycothiol-dependent enzyme [Acidimicrobiales bacterium]